MIYKSPLHIIPEEYHADLSASTLKKVKKKLLLRLQLESKITIEINGQEYDKNQILSAFDELKNQLDFHHRLYQNQLLLQFIENGDLAIFQYNQKHKWLEKEDAFHDWVLKLFSKRLSGIYQELIEEDTTQSLGTIKMIWNANIRLPPKYENTVYAQVYDWLKNRMNAVRSQYSKIVDTENDVVRLKKGLDKNVSFRWVYIYDYLPGFLKPLRDDYCRWNDEILYQFFSRPEQRNLANVLRQDLITLERAARIAAIAVDQEANIALANKLKDAIDTLQFENHFQFAEDYSPEPNKKRKEKSAGKTILFYLSLVIFLRFCLFNNYNTSPSHDFDTMPVSIPSVGENLSASTNSDLDLAEETEKPKLDEEQLAILTLALAAQRRNLSYNFDISSNDSPSKIAKKIARQVLDEAQKQNEKIYNTYTLQSLEKKGTTKKLPTYNVVLEAERMPSSIEINKELPEISSLLFPEKIPEDDYYLNLKIIHRQLPKIQKTYQFTAGANGFRAVYFDHPEIKKISYPKNRTFRITGYFDSEFLLFPKINALINPKKDKLILNTTNFQAFPENNDTFKLSNLHSILSNNELSLSSSWPLKAISLYHSLNGIKRTKQNAFITKDGHVFSQTSDSRSKNIIELKANIQETEAFTKIVIAHYDYKKHFITELHIYTKTTDKLFSTNKSMFNTYTNTDDVLFYSIHLWAYR